MIRVAMATVFPNSPSDVFGGVQMAAFCLAEALSMYPDVDLHVLAIGAGPPRTERWPAYNFTIHWIERTVPGFLTYWNVTRRRIARLAGELSPDVVHFQAAAGWAGPRFAVPKVLTVHGIPERELGLCKGPGAWIRKRVMGIVERRGRARFEHVIMITPYVQHELAGQITGQVHAIGNAVARGYFGIERKEVAGRVLFVGALSLRKNIHGLIEVARMLRDRGAAFELRLAGPFESDVYESLLRGAVSRYGLNERVRFLGNQTPEQVRGELARAACLVLASFQETAPMVISEAMAAGVPVVATNTCGMPYMVVDGETGFLADVGDWQVFARRVQEILESEPTRRKFGVRAAEVARQRYHPDVVARQTREVYYAAASRPVPEG